MHEHCLMTGYANRSSSFDLQCQFKSTEGMTRVNLVCADELGMPCFQPYEATPMGCPENRQSLPSSTLFAKQYASQIVSPLSEPHDITMKLTV